MRSLKASINNAVMRQYGAAAAAVGSAGCGQDADAGGESNSMRWTIWIFILNSWRGT